MTVDSKNVDMPKTSMVTGFLSSYFFQSSARSLMTTSIEGYTAHVLCCCSAGLAARPFFVVDRAVEKLWLEILTGLSNHTLNLNGRSAQS
jgi:hypothetical protein